MTREKCLFIVGIVFTVLFCIELNIIGWINFHSVLSGLEEHHKPFPNQFTRLRVNLEFMGLTIAYILWLIQKRKENFSSFSKILKSCAIFLVIPFITYPRSTDIFQYLQYGLMGLNGVNPYLNPADSFASNLSPFLAWSQSSTYGPISQLFFMAAASTVKVSPLVGVYIFKVFCVILHGINTYLVWDLLKDSNYRSKITTAYLVNPLLLTEYILSAHVDVLIANALLLLLFFLHRHNYLALVLVIWLGFLEKTLPIIWLPFVISFLILNRRWKDIAISSLASVVIVLVLSYTALPTIEAWRSLINPGVTGKTALSLHYLLSSSLSFFPQITSQMTQSLLSAFTLLTTLGFGAFYSFTLLKPYVRRRYSEVNLIADIGWVTLVLLLFATPWLMPWYPSILLPIAALSTSSPIFALVSLTFCLSSNFIYGGAGSGVSLFSIMSTIVVIGPPIGLLVIRPRLRSLNVV